MKNSFGQTALHYAAVYGAIPTAQVILSFTDESNKLLSIKDNEGMTALFYAKKKGDHAMVEFLLYNNSPTLTKSEESRIEKFVVSKCA